MHISEGVLSPAVLAAGAVIALAGLAIGMRKLKESQIPLCGIMAAAFFVASLIHIPVGITSAHLLLTGLTGMLLGWASFPAIFTGLCLQAVLFQYGGLTTLGVNTACMGTAAVAAWYIFRFFSGHAKSVVLFRAGAFCAGASGVIISAVLASIALAFTEEGFKAAAIALLLAHLPVIIVEGFITMFAAVFLMRHRPQIFNFQVQVMETDLCLQKK